MAAMPSTSEWLSGPPGSARKFEGEPKISVPRGLGDEGAGRIDARADHHAFVDGALEPEDGSAEVAHRRESSHQRRFGLPRSQQMEVGRLRQS